MVDVDVDEDSEEVLPPRKRRLTRGRRAVMTAGRNEMARFKRSIESKASVRCVGSIEF